MKFKRVRSFHLLICVMTALTLSGCGSKIDQIVTIQPIGNTIAYAQTAFTVKAGDRVQLIMQNLASAPVMKHNVVLVQPQTDMDALALQLQEANYDPTISDSIIAATPLTDPQQETEVIFIAPKQPGDYPYFCSYVGHTVMRGVMTVLP